MDSRASSVCFNLDRCMERINAQRHRLQIEEVIQLFESSMDDRDPVQRSILESLTTILRKFLVKRTEADNDLHYFEQKLREAPPGDGVQGIRTGDYEQRKRAERLAKQNQDLLIAILMATGALFAVLYRILRTLL